MYEIGVTVRFDATHRLRGPFGPSTEHHGHQYRVDVVARGRDLNEHGALADLGVLREAVDRCVGDLAGRDLDELPAFADRNSTAENLAGYIFDTVAEQFHPPGVTTLSIRVWESPTVWAGYEAPLIREIAKGKGTDQGRAFRTTSNERGVESRVA